MPGQNFNMPNTSMPQGFNQQFPGMQNMAGQQSAYPGVQLTANLAQQQAAIHRMSVEQQRQRAAMMAQQRQGGMNPAMMQQAAAAQQNMGTPTRPQGNLQNMQNNPQRAAEERNFMEKVSKYMQHAQQPFDAQPHLAGRPINLFVLFHLIVRAGSSKRVTQANGWPQLARNLGVAPEQYPNAGAELQQIFVRNLGPWEAAYWNSQGQRMAQLKQQGSAMPGQQNMSPNRGMPQGAQANNQPQNAAYMQQLQQSRMAAMQAQQSPALGQMTPQQSNASLPQQNGWSTPQSGTDAGRPPSIVDQHRKSASRQLEGSPAQAKASTFATPPPVKTSVPPEAKIVNGTAPSRPSHYKPHNNTYEKMMTRLYGGYDIDTIGPIAQGYQAATGAFMPASDLDLPGHLDVGTLDVQALTLSLQSGIAVEVRYALDMLSKLTNDPMLAFTHYIELKECGDLLDVLIDCGEDQVEYLSDESKRIEGLEHGSYEEIARLARVEMQEVQDVPEVGSKKYNRQRAAERLLSVTTILRNLSFPRPIPPRPDLPPDNSDIIAASRAVKFLSHTIGLLATRVISLQSSMNLQDFMKDVIIILSNTAREIVLDSQDDAYNLLQFLLAFAPGPIPTETNPFRFASYKPSVHKYYPNAIDVFAKLLARDDPNRTFFKQIFVDTADHEDAEDSDMPIHQQYDLLTRAFGMAIAVIPDVSGHERKPINRMDDELLRIATARKPTLSQGMLTADLLSMLIPSSDPSLAKAWLRSQDSWGCVLFRVVSELAEHDGGLEVMQKNRHGGHLDPRFVNSEQYQLSVFSSIVSRSMSMLKRLAKKALEDTAQPVRAPAKEDVEEVKTNGVSSEDHSMADGDEDQPAPDKEANEEKLLDDLADLEKSDAADFLPLSDAIFSGIFANTKELTSGVIADYIALGEILH